MPTTPILKRPISYYGGKQAIINHILPLIPDHDVYTEVFFGGGTVFFAKEPVANETINDTLDTCINFYRVLKNNYPALKKFIDHSLYSRSTHVYAQRIITNMIPADDVQRAWAFWYITNFSFAKKIGAGISYSNDQVTTMPKQLQNKKLQFVKDLQLRLENTFIENNEALTILVSRNVKRAFHYIDPPYFNADMGHYPGYTEENFKSLLTWCANECKGKFLLSNYNSEILDEFIQVHGWHKKEIEHRLKAPRKSGATKLEVLVWNYDVSKFSRDLFNQ